MEQPSREQITEALGKVIDPELKRPVTELDMVREVRVDNGHVAVTIALTVAGCPLRSSFETQVAEHLLPLPGVESVSLDFDVMSPEERAALTTKLRGEVSRRSRSISRRRSTGSASAPAFSTPTSTGTRSRTCSVSRNGRWSSTR